MQSQINLWHCMFGALLDLFQNKCARLSVPKSLMMDKLQNFQLKESKNGFNISRTTLPRV